MASRKIAAADKPARTKATGSKAGASKSTTSKSASSKSSTAAKSPTARAGAGTKAPARKAATARKAASPGGKPSSRASKKDITPEHVSRALTGAAPEEHGSTFEAAKIAAEAALDKKAEDVVILDVRGLTSYADYFLVASGTSDRQVSAIADGVEEKMKKSGHRTIGVEGYERGHWVLLDFGDVVAHIFYEEARAFYDIEGLWADARRIPME